MRRTLDPTNLNIVVNHPEVRPWMKGPEGPLDVSDIVSNPANYCFEVDGGGFICISKGQGIYEVHSLFTKAARRHSLQTMRESMEYVFTRTDCFTLVSHFPDDNPMAAAIGRKGGFKSIGMRLEEGPYAPCELKVIELDDWIAQHEPFEEHGKRFHAALEHAKKEHGSELHIHDDDPLHDRYVGAAFRMVERGNIVKGVTIYNNWATRSGYAPVTVLSVVPPVVDVVDAIVSLDPAQGLSVLACR